MPLASGGLRVDGRRSTPERPTARLRLRGRIAIETVTLALLVVRHLVHVDSIPVDIRRLTAATLSS